MRLFILFIHLHVIFHHVSSTPPQHHHHQQQQPNECIDLDPQCSIGAAQGRCVTDHRDMRQYCPASCWTCVNTTALRDAGLSEAEIEHRRRYAQNDWGPLPHFNSRAANAGMAYTRMKHVMAAMDNYARQFSAAVDLDELSLCNNKNPSCAHWAMDGECERNIAYMIDNCALACRICEHVYAYKMCSEFAQQHQKTQAYKPEKWREQILSNSNAKVAVAGDRRDEWVIKVDSLWENDKNRTDLISLADRLSWQPSMAIGYDMEWSIPTDIMGRHHTRYAIRRTTTSAFCSYSDCIRKSETVKGLLSYLTKYTRIPRLSRFLERPLEFVRVASNQSFGKHHDYRLHDSWKVGAYRILTMYINLQGVVDIGFPDLDYTIVRLEQNQVAIWPHANLTTNPQQRSHSMTSEVLAPQDENQEVHVGLILHVHLYEYNEKAPEICRAAP